jgi:hypothetical protein
MALSERARAQDYEDQVKRLTARCNDLVNRERALRRQIGLESAAAEVASSPPLEPEPQMKMVQRPTDPRAATRPEFRTGSYRGSSESGPYTRPPDAPPVRSLSSERLRALVDEAREASESQRLRIEAANPNARPRPSDVRASERLRPPG